MNDIKTRQFVYTAMLNHEKGFTLIELLLTLTIIVVTLPLMIYLFAIFPIDSQIDDLNIEQFILFLRNDILLSERIEVHENKLYFPLKSGKTATIEQYNDVIRRQVDGRGHEIYLRDVHSLFVQEKAYGFDIKIRGLNGEAYEKKMYVFK